MKLSKYEHACFSVEKDGKLLIVDPGNFTTDLGSPENVVGIVVTHSHPDHFDPSALGALIAHNPEAKLYAHESVTRQLGEQNETLPYESVTVGQHISVGPFELEFFGGNHATIHSDIPIIDNLGVMINETIYYPGDSYATPAKHVKVLALPTAAPWMKMSEAINFLIEVKPNLAFPTHDAIDSPNGKALADAIISPFAEKVGTKYQRLIEPLTIDE